MNEEDVTWIYESADGGKTVTRRPITDINPYYADAIQNHNMNTKTVKKILNDLEYEAELREQHPVLQEKYNEYRALLEICKEPNKND